MGTIDTLHATHFAEMASDDLFGEPVIIRIAGSSSSQHIVNVVLDTNALAGTNEAHGDGHTINDTRGRSERQSIAVEVPASVPISDPVQPSRPDVLYRGSDPDSIDSYERYAAKRVLAKDQGSTLVVFVRIASTSTRTRTRGE